MDTPDLVRLRTASNSLGVSVSTVRRWAREKRITLVRLPGGALRVRRSDIARIVAGEDDSDA